jgi:hypothetical protein
MTDWQVVVASVASSASASGLVVWFLRTWIGEHVEQSIRHEYVVAVERLRNELKMDAFQHETRFAQLHAERAQAVRELFSMLHRVKSALMQSTSNSVDIADLPAKRAVVVKAFEVADTYFQEREIYFPEPLAKKINVLFANWAGVFSRFTHDVEGQSQQGKNFHATWQVTYEALYGNLNDLFIDLKNEFRFLLGDAKQP